MVDAENRLGLYIAIPVYFGMLCVCAVWAYRRMERQNKDGTTDHLMNHYLGGRDFGAILSAGTVYASLFSGYTVVGIVNGAFLQGSPSHFPAIQ
jgi:Na+/proline symporter